MDRRGNNAMRLIKTEEEKNLEKIYAPYYDYTKTPALSPDDQTRQLKHIKNNKSCLKENMQKQKLCFLVTEIIEDKN